MKIGNTKWVNTDIQARIKTLPILIIRSVAENAEECNIINIKMRRDPALATSKTYELKFSTFENGKQE